MLRVVRLMEAGKVKDARVAEVAVLAALADEQEFPHRGTINFVDNHVDPNTGTLRVRGVFPNPSSLMSPGLFVRVRLPLGESAPALLIADQALGTDQGQKFVYVVDDKDEVGLPAGQGRAHHGPAGHQGGRRTRRAGRRQRLERVRPNVPVEPKEEEKAESAEKKP